MNKLLFFTEFSLILVFYCISGQLVVNVKNNGGDVYTENIEANTTQDSINLEFRMADGTTVTQFIDGRNEVHIFKVVILPEEERGQTRIQTLCFVLRFAKNEFIASDAMSKLRQKNPSAVRHPEEQRPAETHQLDLGLDVHLSNAISPHIERLCGDARDTTYMKLSDLKLLSQILNRDYSALETVARPLPTSSTPLCSDLLDSPRDTPCTCRYNICIGWYPCGLKYCRGKDSAGRVVSYRCGIKTCSKCREFVFRVAAKNQCIWDETEFTLAEEEMVEPPLDLAMEDGEDEERAVPNPLPVDDVQMAGGAEDRDGKSLDVLQNKQINRVEMEMQKKGFNNNSGAADAKSRDIVVAFERLGSSTVAPSLDDRVKPSPTTISPLPDGVNTTRNNGKQSNVDMKVAAKHGAMNGLKEGGDSAGAVANADNILDDDEDVE